MGNGHTKDTLSPSMREVQAATFKQAVDSGALNTRPNVSFNPGDSEPGGWVVTPEWSGTEWEARQIEEQRSRMEYADQIVRNDGRMIVEIYGRIAAGTATCVATAGGCVALGAYQTGEDIRAGNYKMAAVGGILTVTGGRAAAAELSGLAGVAKARVFKSSGEAIKA